jgi:heme exporter protein A
MLHVHKLSCMRGDRRLFADLDLALDAGELLYVHGHNGSGKTTLLRALCGLIRPEDGEIRWRGEDIRSLREDFARDLLYLGHKNGIKGDLTAVENLQVSSVLDGFPVSGQQAWAALGRIGLDGHEDLETKVLSQGQQRRVALARLLVNKAPLWILDEPFVALDKAAVELLQQVIREHVAGGGMVVLTTHQEVPLTDGTVKRLKLGWRD